MSVVAESEIIFNAKGKNPSSNPEIEKFYKKESHDGTKFTFTRHRRALTEKEKEELRIEYSSVVVNDYGDEYHMSDEDRKRKFKYYEAFSKIRRCKRKFHKLDDFVRVYRLCIDCLKVVAEDNGVYDPEKFMRMVIRGQIEVFGLHFPKYIGKDRKDINWEYVSEFVTDRSKDPTELSKSFESELSKLSDDELKEQLLTDEEFERIMEHLNDKPDEIKLNPDEDYIEEHGIVQRASKKDFKKLVDMSPYFLKSIKEAAKEQRRKERNAGRLNSFVYEMRNEDFDYIAGIDSKRGYQSVSDMPVFKGDIMNRKDYMLYLKALDDYENTQIKVNYKGKMRTQSEIDEIELKDALESAGWNVRNLYKGKDEEKKLKKAYKRDKKREEELKKRLLEVQKRQKKRGKSAAIEFDAKKKKKHKKKKEGD